jgi:hypothetical protein
MRGPLAGLGALVLALAASPPSSAAQECSDAIDDVRHRMQEASLDDITKDKIKRLLETASGLCGRGEQEETATKLVQARELLESDTRD